MKKLFLSLLIIVHVISQSTYAMDREFIVREGIRAGLSIGSGALVGLGLVKLASKGYLDFKSSDKVSTISGLASVTVGSVNVFVNDPYPSLSPLWYDLFSDLSPLFYSFGGSLFALKKYQDYLDTFDYFGHWVTPLSREIDRENPSLPKINRLLESKADPNVKSGYRNETSLIYAVTRKKPDLDLIKTLLQHKVDINAKDAFGITPLIFSILAFQPDSWREPSLDLVNFLLENKADPNLCKGDHGPTPLMEAVNIGNLNVINTLLQHKADPSVRWKYGEALLIEEVGHKKPNLGVINALLEHKADPNVQYKDGETLLMKEASRTKPNLDLISILLRYKADPTMLDKNGKPLFMREINREKPNPDVVKLLLESVNIYEVINNQYEDKKYNGKSSYTDYLKREHFRNFLEGYACGRKVTNLLSYNSRLHSWETFQIVLKSASCGYFSFFNRCNLYSYNKMWREWAIEKVDDNGKSVLDYALKYKNYEAIRNILWFIIDFYSESKTSLRYQCLCFLHENLFSVNNKFFSTSLKGSEYREKLEDAFSLEKPENIEKLKNVFYILTVPYGT